MLGESHEIQKVVDVLAKLDFNTKTDAKFAYTYGIYNLIGCQYLRGYISLTVKGFTIACH